MNNVSWLFRIVRKALGKVKVTAFVYVVDKQTGRGNQPNDFF